jgi:hypothetical protein
MTEYDAHALYYMFKEPDVDDSRTHRDLYIDCEFVPADLTAKGLLSMALVDDTGRTFYGINAQANWSAAYRMPFMKDHVLPHMPIVFHRDWAPELAVHPDPANDFVMSYDELRDAVGEYFDGWDRHDMTLYAWCGAQDLTRLHGLWNHDWSTMPDSIPHWLMDLEALADEHHINMSEAPPQNEFAHHALEDAMHDHHIHQFLKAKIAEKYNQLPPGYLR